MDDTGDFTFCKVGVQADDECLGSPKTIPNINKITLEDSPLNGEITHKINNLVQDDSFGDHGALRSMASDASPSNGSNDMAAPKSEALTPEVVGEAGDKLKQPQEKKTIIKKPAVRAKVPFEKGYSQMDWLKLTRTHPDLAGLKGRSNRRLISMDEVRQHKAEGSIWTVLKGRVYNISPYMKFHPGGVDMLMKSAGRDCTSLFNKYHAWVNAEFLLEKCLVGVLDESV